MDAQESFKYIFKKHYQTINDKKFKTSFQKWPKKLGGGGGGEDIERKGHRCVVEIYIYQDNNFWIENGLPTVFPL